MSKRTKIRRARGGTPTPQGQDTDTGRAAGSGDFIGQVGLFETGNGLPHGPGAILAAIAVAIVIYPISRFVRFLTRR